jgi:hypothetical protein
VQIAPDPVPQAAEKGKAASAEKGKRAKKAGKKKANRNPK